MRGGWVIGDLETHDEVCRYLSRELPAVVVAVDYRRAPEHPYPAAIEDYWTAVRWLAENAGALGADPGALVVAGDSAGGNLAAAAALRARDAGGPAIAAQALAYPVTDATRQSAADPAGSYARWGEGYGLTAATMAWFIDCYLPDPASRAAADNSPLLVPDLSGLPPAVVATAEYDPLRDEGAGYAARLRDAGVPVTFLPGDGLVHGFLYQARLARAAGQARQEFTAALRAILRSAGDRARRAGREGRAVTAAPITGSDAEIRAAVADAELPPLLAALAHLTGEPLPGPAAAADDQPRRAAGRLLRPPAGRGPRPGRRAADGHPGRPRPGAARGGRPRWGGPGRAAGYGPVPGRGHG